MNTGKTIAGFLRAPLLHFVVIGVVLGVLYAWVWKRDADESDRTIRITSADIERLQAGWQARWNRPPTPDEMGGLIKAQIREAALYREAVAMGLDQDDAVIRRVLVQKLETIARDLVEISLAPTEQDLANYFEENADNYRPPPVITFTQVFIDPDKRGDRTLDDADEILAELRSLGTPPDDLDKYGDPLMLQRYFPEKTELRIAQSFGREFARSIFELTPGEWHGPVPSGYGTHLVFVAEKTVFPTPSLAEVEESVRRDWVDAKREEITDNYFAEILDRYTIVVEQESYAESVDGAVAQTP